VADPVIEALISLYAAAPLLYGPDRGVAALRDSLAFMHHAALS